MIYWCKQQLTLIQAAWAGTLRRPALLSRRVNPVDSASQRTGRYTRTLGNNAIGIGWHDVVYFLLHGGPRGRVDVELPAGLEQSRRGCEMEGNGRIVDMAEYHSLLLIISGGRIHNTFVRARTAAAAAM